MDVVGIAGSLRQGSFNQAVLRAAVGLAPADMAIAIHDIADVPLYDFDVEQQGDPPGVVRLKEAIAAADGVLIVTPEYQHGSPAYSRTPSTGPHVHRDSPSCRPSPSPSWGPVPA